MLDFFAQYGADITALVVALGSALATLYAIIKMVKTRKDAFLSAQSLTEKVEITREGIVEAFKQAKIPNEVKLSISNQVNSILSKFRDEVITMLKETEGMRTQAMVMILKILSYTAASNKLTDEEKAQINDLVKLISEADATIDITD